MASEMAVEAARVVFGIPGGNSGPEHLQRWLKKWCRDYKTTVHNDVHQAEFLFHKPVTKKWLVNTIQVHAKNWGFKRDVHCKANLRIKTKDQYIAGGAGPPVQALVSKMLGKIYDNLLTEVERLRRFDVEEPLAKKPRLEPLAMPTGLVVVDANPDRSPPQPWTERAKL